VVSVAVTVPHHDAQSFFFPVFQLLKFPQIFFQVFEVSKNHDFIMFLPTLFHNLIKEAL